MIFFDLEFYVPPEDRQQPGSRGTLVFNPTKAKHVILGGRLVSSPLSAHKSPTSAQLRQDKALWLWNYPSEKELLEAIMHTFEEEYHYQQGESTVILDKRIKDIVTCGFAIARIDLPALYIRSHYNHVAPPSHLFQTFLKTKIIDLCNVSAFLFPQEPTFYPKTAYEVCKRLIPDTKWKPSGKLVWKYYDEGEYDKIESRCYNEVTDILQIYKKLQSHIAHPRKD